MGAASASPALLQRALKNEPDHTGALELRLEIELALGRYPPHIPVPAPLPHHVLIPPELKAPEFILLSRLLMARSDSDERFLAIAGHLVPPVAMSPAIPDELVLALPALLEASISSGAEALGNRFGGIGIQQKDAHESPSSWARSDASAGQIVKLVAAYVDLALSEAPDMRDHRVCLRDPRASRQFVGDRDLVGE